MNISICVPVLKRYDLLRDLLHSLDIGAVKPTAVYVINNGQRDMAPIFLDFTLNVHTPTEPLGVAASWNWFIRNVAEERVIVNDDITFAPASLATLVGTEGDIVWARGAGFSCFVLRDSCVKKIGMFDETISPGYGYYEDEDYLQRLDGRGRRTPSAIAADVACGVTHRKSATLEARTPEEMRDHHYRFAVAQANYMKKWHITHQEMFGHD